MAETKSDDATKASQQIILTIAVYLIAAVLTLLPFLYAIEWKLSDVWYWNPYVVTLDVRAFFVFLAVLPGALAFVYHLVTVSGRRERNHKLIEAFYQFRDQSSAARKFEKGLGPTPETTRGPVSANAASALLTAVFLFVALLTGYNTGTGMDGVKFAGYGAYIAVLYVMVPRIYASALSSRFLMNSALRSASAIALGFVLSIGGAVLSANTQATNAVIFLSGLFHIWAIDALRQRARTVFGQATPEAAELPISIVQGIDDTSADLLSEYGVTSVQHLATADPGDLCERTLLPIDRVLGWIDQGILIQRLEGNIRGARSMGIGGASDVVAASLSEDAAALLKSLAEKTNMTEAAVTMIAGQLSRQGMVRLIYKLRYGAELGAPPQSDVATQIANTLVVVGLNDPQPIGWLQLRDP